jgi:hypothetical protein
MTIRQNIIIPVILALSTAGSIAAGSAVAVTAAQAPSASVATMHPATYFHG